MEGLERLSRGAAIKYAIRQTCNAFQRESTSFPDTGDSVLILSPLYVGYYYLKGRGHINVTEVEGKRNS